MSVLAGEIATAGDYNAGQVRPYVKPSNETRTSTTTYADDADLAGIPLGVGSFEIVADIAMIGGAAGIAIKTQWGFSGTWNTPLRQCVGPTSGNTTAGNGAVSTQRTAYASNADAVYGLSTSGFYTLARESSWQVTVTVAGLFALRWAPNVSSGTSGGLRQGSAVRVRQIL